jgi:hypothetical protein
VGETAILLDSKSGQTWQLRLPRDGKEPVWVPIRKAEGTADSSEGGGTGKEVPLVEPLNIQGFPVHFAPEGLSKQEAGDWYKTSGPTSPRATVFRSLAEAGKVLDERARARIAGQFDPRRQQLVLFTWVSWSCSDRLTHRVRDGKVEFVYEAGSSHGGAKCGEDRPNTYSRLFAVRRGITWEMFHGGSTDPKEREAGQKPEGKSR